VNFRRLRETRVKSLMALREPLRGPFSRATCAGPTPPETRQLLLHGRTLWNLPTHKAPEYADSLSLAVEHTNSTVYHYGTPGVSFDYPRAQASRHERTKLTRRLHIGKGPAGLSGRYFRQIHNDLLTAYLVLTEHQTVPPRRKQVTVIFFRNVGRKAQVTIAIIKRTPSCAPWAAASGA
jgi:hypothetical protein